MASRFGTSALRVSKSLVGWRYTCRRRTGCEFLCVLVQVEATAFGTHDDGGTWLRRSVR